MARDRWISAGVATAVGLGSIIGAGIFVLSGTAISLAGAEALVAFLLVGVVALIIAFELGELGSLMPHLKGATYSYVYKAFGSELGFITGILLYFSYASSISVVTLGFGSYLAGLVGVSQQSMYPILFAILLIGTLAIINVLGIKKAAEADFVLVLIKVGILALFVVFAVYAVSTTGKSFLSNFALLPDKSGLSQIFAASVVIFFAYTGFQTISTFTDRIKGGVRGAARAIIGSVVISMILYTFVAFALLMLLPASAYTISGNPLGFALQSISAPGWLFVLVSVGALIATASAALADILSSSRMLYQISVDRLLPPFARAYDKKRDVAVNGVMISALIGVGMLFVGNIYVITAISNFGFLFSYLMTSLALVHFRRKGSTPEFKMPLYPYLPIISIIGLMAFFIGMPALALLIGLMTVFSLIIVYYSLREIMKKKVVRVRLFR